MKMWKKSESSLQKYNLISQLWKYNLISQLWNQFILTYSGDRVSSAVYYTFKKIISVFYWLGHTAGQSKVICHFLTAWYN